MEKDKNIFFIPETETSALLFIDMQERLVSAMSKSIKTTIKKQEILLKSANLLNLLVIATEQYPQGLGNTLKSLKNLFPESTRFFEKSTFSSLGSTEVRIHLNKKNIKTVILVGIESHVCILQTALDLLSLGYQTIILKDAVNSRNEIDMETALETAKSAGGFVLTIESLIFMLMRTSKHPEFRNISKLLK